MTETEQLTSLISESAKEKIDRWLEKYPPEKKRSGLLFALRVLQDENKGWLTTQLIEAAADYLDLPHIAAFEVATFYSMYDLKPVGRHKVKVCTSISCMLRGSDKIIAHLRDRLGVSMGDTTPDGCFTLQHAECLAACGNAPVIQINDEQYYEDINPEKVDLLLEEIRVRESNDGK